MRPALWPPLTPTPSRWINLDSCKGFARYRRSASIVVPDHRHAHAVSRPLTTRTRTKTPASNDEDVAAASWDLKDLPRVSKESSSPLIFHLTSDNPYHNLSLEHYLLTHSDPESRILLFYTNRPCVVIGRNQNPWLETDLKRLKEGLVPEEELEMAKKPTDTTTGQQLRTPTTPRSRLVNNLHDQIPIDLVRRRSGGGTVFHDSGNLNYSVIVPNSKSFERSTHAEMVVRALSSHKLKQGLSSVFPDYQNLQVQVNDRNDIVMRCRSDAVEGQWLKISGSAYKLTRGHALHHGTLLYSSPYIDRISELLRSPGREFIHAKGVESVRSKVANLVWTPDVEQRREVRRHITDAIVREFWAMYGSGQQRTHGINEIALDDAECTGHQNPDVAAGVAELASDAWRFEQTPRFDFDSGVLDGTSVSFQASHGVLEHLTLKDAAGHALVRKQKQNNDFGQHDVKLSDVESWRDLLASRPGEGHADSPAESNPPSNINVPDALIARIEATFPRWRG